jgi:hypothetical protein
MITPVNPNLFSHRNRFTRLVLKTTSFKSFLYPKKLLLHENSWGSSSHPSPVFSLVYLQHNITFLMPTYNSRKIFVDVELQLEFSPYI